MRDDAKVQIVINLNRRVIGLILALAALGYPAYLLASSLTTPNTFVNGTIADADEVNANFAAVETAINDNNARIADPSTFVLLKRAIEQLIPNATPTILLFPGSLQTPDPEGLYDPAQPDRLTLSDGNWVIAAHVEFEGTTGGGNRRLCILASDPAIAIACVSRGSVSTDVDALSVTTILPVIGGTVVHLQVEQTSGGDLNVRASGLTYTPIFSVLGVDR